jgi:hypothetical protein
MSSHSNRPAGGKRQLGKILLQRKMVSPAELESALSQQRRTPTPVPIASQLVDDGVVPEEAALLALSEQTGVPAVDVTQSVVAAAHLSCIPRAAAEALQILPLAVDGEAVILAMADPSNRKAIDEVEFATGKAVRPRVALHSALAAAITGAYDAKAAGESCYRGPKAPAALTDSAALRNRS